MIESTGDYLGSQAYSHVTGGSEGINRNTGSVEFSQVLLDLRGVLGTIGLTISLRYSYGVSGRFGLPRNWSFNIPHIIDGQSFTSQGKTFLIDNDWADTTGYQSGLKYVNNHGMSFMAQIPSEKLPSGKDGEYTWRFRQTDGSVQYFDAAGNILEHDDVFGNFIYYSYVNNTSFLEYIQDSFGQKITFNYQAGESITITAPDGGLSIIEIANENVARSTDPAGLITAFGYTNTPSQGLLSRIEYPSCLVSEFTYGRISYLTADGGTDFVPVVTNHYHRDSAGTELTQTTYQFGSGTNGGTFTGYNLGIRFGSQQDALIESDSYRYRYDTLVQNVDSSGRILSATQIFFNQLHLPAEEYHYSVPHGAELVHSYKTTYTYDIDPDVHARNINYASPTQTQQFNFDGNSYVALRSETCAYDEYGCLLSHVESAFDVTTGREIKQKTSSKTYVQVSWGGQMIQSELLIDEVSGSQRLLTYTLTEDEKQVRSTVIEFKALSEPNFLPWKTKTQEFDKCGRALNEKISWSQGVPFPAGTIVNYDMSLTYEFDLGTGLYTVIITDPQGNASKQTYDMRIRSGPLVQKTLPLGQSENFTYDMIGRASTYTDPSNCSSSMTYIVGSGGNSASTTASSGYKSQQIFDVLGRQIQLLDNGGSAQISNKTNIRTLSTTAWDPLSRKQSETDTIGSKVTFDAYDAFNRLLSTTDAIGNVTTHSYDDHNLTSEYAMNGDRRGLTQFDAYGRAIRIEQFPDSDDLTTTYSLVTTHMYDGLGNICTSVLTKQPNESSSPSITLQTTSVAFDVENAIIEKTVVTKSDLGDHTYDTVTRCLQYDIFGQIYRQNKTVTYSDGRVFNHEGCISRYDSCNQLASHTNGLGQTERYTYDANGNMSSLTRYDGTIVSYNHDSLGRVVHVRYGAEDIEQRYLANGRLSEVSTGAGTVRHIYNLDGSASAVTYADGSSQTYSLSQCGQVAQSKDAIGTKQDVIYDTYGHVLTRTLGIDIVSYEYGSANHTQGQLVSLDISGGQQHLRRVLSYNGFGRVNRVTVTSNQSEDVLLDSIYLYNSQGKLYKVEQSSQTWPEKPELNYQRTFLYDGLSQLRQDSIVYSNTNVTTLTEFVYDGNSNLITTILNGAVENMSYNAIDQRNDPGFTYDANGRLTADDKGRKYTYGEQDQLLSVDVGEANTNFSYHPNGALSLHHSGVDQTNIWYDTGAANATRSAARVENAKSYLLDPGHRLISVKKTNQDTAYYVDSQGSIVVETGVGGSNSTIYGVYGQEQSSATTEAYNFGYRQEFTDKASGLVYLRSRYYQPDYAAFITMDSVHKENRYAFCLGDPINLYDGTGHIEWIPLIVDIAVTVVVATACAPAAGAVGAALFGADTIGASITASVLSKATGYVTGGYVGRKMQHEHYSGQKFAIDAFSGALAGVVAASSAAGLLDGARNRAVERGLSAVDAAAFAEKSSSFAGKVLGVTAGMTSLSTLNHAAESGTALTSVTGSRSASTRGLQYTGAYDGIFANITPGVSLEPRSFGGPTDSDRARGLDLDLDWRMLNLVGPQDEYDLSASKDYKDQKRTGQLHVNLNQATNADTASSSSVGNSLHIETRYLQNGEIVTNVRPLKCRLFAQQQYLQSSGFGRSDPRVNACFGGLSNGQDIANALGKRVWATYATR
ncbi:hypothetical protein AUEXF2481DRAFT_32101 [Aureobasidium subglaciale EXF-2481]|uniref:Uncharacterized protein n=1 Tax=Aureobasidium subglaciale (strain EXF-2481) TaxID=1043005 RepID=A0A074Y947_AURSE|nr:uncharacterized protein AUEXF2481DRAFT_32101 [Aureobasidium subglaciale EXF-2481]KAI5210810.1 hypothetical protein E4T38_01769 [Aureobasidium subglaciale]KAI5229411.1 hypothetical protein E4T40_01711 [Aureobasidium subglaciale]KAI5232950.1 hypothetical protein E4T41_01767 [Aureobasidium subglaciale]KAI5266303.1 hypothetical protein E4T46_01708 [Aureobasidium subglaciale]KEQ92509.1 hypothetical protein AUEXF2481DRAFT_32101 [Aureobasidium subglaciale EXF-2481]